MTALLTWFIGGAAAYLLGSVPFGFLIAKARGKDIRALGSGNIGATNVFRSVSKPLGILTFALDFLKGLCGVKLVPALAAAAAACADAPGAGGGAGVGVGAGMGLALFCGAMTVAGHNWTCFLGFKGGKGIATSAGLVLGLTPAGVGLAFAVWLALFLGTRYVSVASVGAALTLAAGVWWPLRLYAAHGLWFPCILTLLALVAVWKHRSNIARLRAGTESRFDFKRKKAHGH
jgi:glycerol-3-phosphate acyltransferase PlsY